MPLLLSPSSVSIVPPESKFSSNRPSSSCSADHFLKSLFLCATGELAASACVSNVGGGNDAKRVFEINSCVDMFPSNISVDEG